MTEAARAIAEIVLAFAALLAAAGLGGGALCWGMSYLLAANTDDWLARLGSDDPTVH